MSKRNKTTKLKKNDVVRLWLKLQGLTNPREKKLTRARFIQFLEQVGALQMDSVNVLDRAHYITLWSRFGPYNKETLDKWVYEDRVAYEYWGHEASVLPASHLPLSRRAQAKFEPRGNWWANRTPSAASIRRVMGRIRKEGPLESAQFENPKGAAGPWWGWKEDKQSLELLWHRGRLATSSRRSFRRFYDLAERVYPKGPTASARDLEDCWLTVGLGGTGVASQAHLHNYFTSPKPSAATRNKIIERALANRRILEVRVEGFTEKYYALPKQLEAVGKAPPSRGTTLICPFDSLLWQRSRAEDLLSFRYRVEIYVPKSKRQYGYYVMPILHDGKLVGRVDPKLHRDRGELQIIAIHLEPGIKRSTALDRGLASALTSLAAQVEAHNISLPRAYKKILG